MATRRQKLNKRMEDQKKTRSKNARKKNKERARRAAREKKLAEGK